MNPKLYWINGPWTGKLAISARPRGGDWLKDEIAGWRRAGVDVVLSLLTDHENEDLQLSQESSLSQASGLRFFQFAVEDRGVPVSRDDASKLIARLDDLLRKGQNVAVHCRQGIGRSGMFVAALLALNGYSADGAMQAVSGVRGLTVPETPEQIRWVTQFARADAPSSIPASRISVK
jgi:protein-tyrosine phosphatase